MKHSFFFFSSRRRHTRSTRDWSSDVCSSDLDRRRTLQRTAGVLAPGGSLDAVGQTSWRRALDRNGRVLSRADGTRPVRGWLGVLALTVALATVALATVALAGFAAPAVAQDAGSPVGSKAPVVSVHDL